MATRAGVPVLAALMLTLLAAGVAAAPAAQPNLPEPRPIVADPNTTALLVLDMSTRCDVPGAVCGELGPVMMSHYRNRLSADPLARVTGGANHAADRRNVPADVLNRAPKGDIRV